MEEIISEVIFRDFLIHYRIHVDVEVHFLDKKADFKKVENLD